jgi:hypothetical protein
MTLLISFVPTAALASISKECKKLAERFAAAEAMDTLSLAALRTCVTSELNAQLGIRPVPAPAPRPVPPPAPPPGAAPLPSESPEQQ